jgi:hypothetical protein
LSNLAGSPGGWKPPNRLIDFFLRAPIREGATNMPDNPVNRAWQKGVAPGRRSVAPFSRLQNCSYPVSVFSASVTLLFVTEFGFNLYLTCSWSATQSDESNEKNILPH